MESSKSKASSSRKRDQASRRDKERSRRNGDQSAGDGHNQSAEIPHQAQSEEVVATSLDPASSANQATSNLREIANTIKEANKLRAELGMPLLEEVDETALAAASEQQERQSEQQEQQVDPSVTHKTLEIMAKIEKAKKNRQRTQVIGKSLGEELAEEDQGVLSWVMKHKSAASEDGAKKRERELAKRTARMLDDADSMSLGAEEEADAEDKKETNAEGEDRSARKRRRQHQRNAGVSIPTVIAHRPEDLNEGEVVMILKDAPVLAGSGTLNEEEDELENINLFELQKAKEYQERKKRKPLYDVYGDLDSSGKKNILAQYDDKPDRAKFKLDDEGRVKVDVETQLDRVRERLNANQKMLYDISGSTGSVASDFYNHEELVSFKKTGDKKKSRKKKKLRKKSSTVDLIKAIESEKPDEEEGEDHGSRAVAAKQKKEEAERLAELARRKEGWSKAVERAREESLSIFGTRGVREVPDEEEEKEIAKEDEMEVEEGLYSAVAQARREALAKKLRHKNVAETIAQTRKRKEERTHGESGDIVLSETTEFCASLPTEGLALKTKKKKKAAEAMLEEHQMQKDREREAASEIERKSGFRVVEPGSAASGSSAPRAPGVSVEEQQQFQSIVPEEPLVAKGLAATLQLLNQQGGVKALELDSVSGRARDKVLEIPDVDDPAPRLRLDKYDEFGRKMTPREAFRHLSHKFHGKMPGKKKMEKKIQRYEEELKRKKMSSIDTPLMSLEAMQKAQQANKAPYLVLTSKSATSQGSLDISKPPK